MNFFQARAVAQQNHLHIRRASWPAAKWIYYQRAQWLVFGVHGTDKEKRGGQTVCATDFGRDDLNATDWTTMPAALAACPITPSEPGGGGPPGPDFPGFPPSGGPPGGFPPPPGSPPPPGGGGGGGTLPPTNDAATGITVTFDSLFFDEGHPDVIEKVDLNGPHPLEKTGATTWTATVKSGTLHPDEIPIEWKIDVVLNPLGGLPSDPLSKHFTVAMVSVTGVSHGLFGSFVTGGTGDIKGHSIPNTNTATGYVHSGNATVI